MTASRTTSFVAGLVPVALFIVAAFADGPEPAMPDPTLTPGVVASTDVREVCGRGPGGLTYSQAHRQTTREMKLAAIREYGLTPPFHGEVDHRVPLCLGGADDIGNLWPQSDYEAKDELEALSCRLVCAGQVPLDEAQGWFLEDWRTQLWRVGR